MKQTPLKKGSFFYAPIWLGDFSQAVSALKNDKRYITVEKKDTPQYFLPYATDIYNNDKLFFAFELKREFFPALCMYTEFLKLSESPKLQSIKLYCFATGCAFAEFYIAYDGLDIKQIVDFTFQFKNATRTDRYNGYSLTMYDALVDLLSACPNAIPFFTGSDFKRECRMFHHIFDDDCSVTNVQKHIRHLARGYHNNFLLPENDSDYDMIYQPYFYDFWAGSQEGLVNYYHISNDETTDRFLNGYKYSHIYQNYTFMYLLLLNQRFSAIHLISEITKYDSFTKKEKKALNSKIVQLKTTFAFNIVSDDQIYQNVYKRMYDILDIDRLLDDIRDNEQQVDIIQNYETLETEKLTSRFLFGLSILSVFSVLIDASSYFDRLPFLQEISTVLSFCCLAAIILSYVVWWIRYNKK